MRENRSVEDMEDVTTAELLAYRQSLQHLEGSAQKRYLTAIKSFFGVGTGSRDNPNESSRITEVTRRCWQQGTSVFNTG